MTEEKKSEKSSMKKILVVEDEKPLAKALQVKLSKAGYEAEAVFNGSEALEAIKKTSYDLILLDLLMPSMDGWDFMSDLQKNENKTKIMIISNLSQQEDIERAKKLGAVEFLVKSDVSLAEIVEKVRALLS